MGILGLFNSLAVNLLSASLGCIRVNVSNDSAISSGSLLNCSSINIIG